MARSNEKSSLKRAKPSQGDEPSETKKPRRSDRLSSQSQSSPEPKAILNKSQLPSPVTHDASTITRDGTVTPPEGRPSQIQHRTPISSPGAPNSLTSPPSDTQPYSQLIHPPKSLSDEVHDEEKEGVWGYLIPMDQTFGDTLVLRQRAACPMPKSSLKKGNGKQRVDKSTYEQQERNYEETKIQGVAAGGYLIGRHPECDRLIDLPTISNRHCLIFKENKGGDTIAILEDLSGNGTFVNESFVGRNRRRELREGDEIAVLDKARFIFRYPRMRDAHGFHAQFSIQEQLGKGHFATVYLAVEKSSGMKYAVKKFEKRAGPGEKSKLEGLQQEIGVLMGVSHPNVLCLKDTFNENDGVYLVLELAAEGELFNWIVMKSKLSEAETRKVFIQLFQGLKYLHERNVVHRDIKPENILLVDKSLSVKLADFGLAKIIGEESFTTTLCGTPSYVAPEILESSNHRRYTRAVDIWSLGVVLYICLCGFPPFSDELYSKENPYTLSQQIKLGRFDYPSPYWDAVDDSALDLIDHMLTVDVDKRFTVDDCLEHPWTIQQSIDPADSTDGLTGAMHELDFSKRKPHRERTLLSSINDVRVSRTITVHPEAAPVKVFSKNKGQNYTQDNPREVMHVGTGKDEQIFGDDAGSQYPS